MRPASDIGGSVDLDQIGTGSELINIKTQTQEIGIDDFGAEA